MNMNLVGFHCFILGRFLSFISLTVGPFPVRATNQGGHSHGLEEHVSAPSGVSNHCHVSCAGCT